MPRYVPIQFPQCFYNASGAPVVAPTAAVAATLPPTHQASAPRPLTADARIQAQNVQQWAKNQTASSQPGAPKSTAVTTASSTISPQMAQLMAQFQQTQDPAIAAQMAALAALQSSK